jgi:hypothetical protein
MLKAHSPLPDDANPADVAFLLTDGTKVGFGEAPGHGELLEEVLGDSFELVLAIDLFDATVEFLRLTGAVRYAHGFSVPVYHTVRRPTSKQLGVLLDDFYTHFGYADHLFQIELERDGDFVQYQSTEPNEKEVRAFMNKHKAPEPVVSPKGKKTKRICSWCKTFMGYADFEKGGITHGICKSCVKTFEEEEE